VSRDADRPPSSSSRRTLRAVTDALEKRYGRPRRRPQGDVVASLVGTILSQNTSDVNSSRAFERLRERFASWQDVANARAASIESAVRSGGLAKTKSRRIREILRSIRSRTGELDLAFLADMSTEDVIEYLMSFDGVGRKTAACVALFELGRDIVPVDTHVHRVISRLGVVGSPRTPEESFDRLRELTPAGRALSLHVNLINLGRELCRPRLPRCSECPLKGCCAHAA
jgi:endonuclease-3